MAVSERDIFIQAGTQVRASFDEGQSFVFGGGTADIVNYSRWGSDLVLELASGSVVRIDDFFLRGVGFHHLILIDGNKRLEADFSRALDQGGDGIDDRLVNVGNELAGDASVSLRTLLIGGAAVAGGGAAVAIANNSDDSSPPAYQFPKPQVFLVDEYSEEGKGWLSGKATRDTKPHLKGQGVPGATISLVVNDGEAIKITVKEDGTWEYEFPNALAEAHYKVKVSQNDAAGHHSEAEFDFVIDLTAPDAPILGWIESNVAPAGEVKDGLTNDNTPTFFGKAETGAKIEIYVEIDGKKELYGSTNANSEGIWSVELTKSLADGKHTIIITATDAAGNVSKATETELEIDTKLPASLELDNITAYGDLGDPASLITDGKTAQKKFSFKIKAADTDIAKVAIYNNGVFFADATEVDADGNWIFTFEDGLAFGNYNFTFEPHDKAGNKAPWGGVQYSISVEDPAASTLASLFSDSFDGVGGEHEGAVAFFDQAAGHDDLMHDSLPVIF